MHTTSGDLVIRAAQTIRLLHQENKELARRVTRGTGYDEDRNPENSGIRGKDNPRVLCLSSEQSSAYPSIENETVRRGTDLFEPPIGIRSQEFEEAGIEACWPVCLCPRCENRTMHS